MSLHKIIAANVRSARLAAGLTQEQLAKVAGINVQYLSKIEREGGNLTIDILEALAVALELQVIDLLQGSPSAKPSRHLLKKYDEAVRFLQSFRKLLDAQE